MKKLNFLIVSAAVVAAIFSTQVRAQDSTASGGGIQVTEAKLGTNVEQRELTGEDSSFAVNSKVFLWMKTTGGSSDQLTVTWKSGDLSYSTTLLIGGSPWRTWATKTATKAGDWTVTVTDASGNTLKEMSFKVQ